jgi:vacuolar-type H+-ATPase subunit E/Vma4
MGSNENTRGDAIELWGRSFNLVKRGLEEAQVVSFVTKLMNERDELRKQEEHFASLTKLAERTVVESDKLAEEIKKEATNQAKGEADTLIAKAEKQARQMAEEKRKEIEEKRAEVLATAAGEAEAIKANAERNAKLLIESHRQKIQPELREMVQQVYSQLFDQLEAFKQQAIGLKLELEERLSRPVEEIDTEVPTTDYRPAPAATAKAGVEKEKAATVPEVAVPNKNEVGTAKAAAVAAPGNGEDNLTYEGEVELEVIPPINIMQIISVMQQLDSLPQIAATELIPLYDRPSIVASLREPLRLLDVLGKLPEVAEVTAVSEAPIAETDPLRSAPRRRKIQIKLTDGKSTTDDHGDNKLNSEISNLFSNPSNPSKN